MKWLYIVFGIVGGLTPTAYIYFRISTSPNYTGAQFDPVLVLRGLLVGFVAVPVFIGAALVVAALGHLSLNLLRRYRRRPSGPTGRSDSLLGDGSSWISRRPRSRP